MEELRASDFGYRGEDEKVNEMVDVINKVLNTLEDKNMPFDKEDIIEKYQRKCERNFDFGAIETYIITNIGEAVQDYVNEGLNNIEAHRSGLYITTDLSDNATVIINGMLYDEQKPREHYIPTGDEYRTIQTEQIAEDLLWRDEQLKNLQKEVEKSNIYVDVNYKSLTVMSGSADKGEEIKTLVEVPLKDIYEETFKGWRTTSEREISNALTASVKENIVDAISKAVDIVEKTDKEAGKSNPKKFDKTDD